MHSNAIVRRTYLMPYSQQYRSLVAIAIAGALTTSSVTAWAQTAPTRGQTGQARGGAGQAQGTSAAEITATFRRATAAFDARDFETALRLYQQAYINSEQPEFLMNIAQSLEQLNRWSDARAALRRYLETARDIPNREDVEAQIRTLDARIAAPTAATTTTTPTTGTTIGTTGSGANANGAANSSTNAGTGNGGNRTQEPPPPPPARPVWPWITLGVGGALAVGGSVMLVLRPDAAGCVGGGNPPCSETEFLSRRDTAGWMTPVAIGALAVGGGLIVTGIIGAVIGGPRRTENSAAATTTRLPRSTQTTGSIAVVPTLSGIEVFGAF